MDESAIVGRIENVWRIDTTEPAIEGIDTDIETAIENVWRIDTTETAIETAWIETAIETAIETCIETAIDTAIETVRKTDGIETDGCAIGICQNIRYNESAIHIVVSLGIQIVSIFFVYFFKISSACMKYFSQVV